VDQNATRATGLGSRDLSGGLFTVVIALLRGNERLGSPLIVSCSRGDAVLLRQLSSSSVAWTKPMLRARRFKRKGVSQGDSRRVRSVRVAGRAVLIPACTQGHLPLSPLQADCGTCRSRIGSSSRPGRGSPAQQGPRAGADVARAAGNRRPEADPDVDRDAGSG